jgi:hypothetical protein
MLDERKLNRLTRLLADAVKPGRNIGDAQTRTAVPVTIRQGLGNSQTRDSLNGSSDFVGELFKEGVSESPLLTLLIDSFFGFKYRRQ